MHVSDRARHLVDSLYCILVKSQAANEVLLLPLNFDLNTTPQQQYETKNHQDAPQMHKTPRQPQSIERS
jgi:hypothetical protein